MPATAADLRPSDTPRAHAARPAWTEAASPTISAAALAAIVYALYDPKRDDRPATDVKARRGQQMQQAAGQIVRGVIGDFHPHVERSVMYQFVHQYALKNGEPVADPGVNALAALITQALDQIPTRVEDRRWRNLTRANRQRLIDAVPSVRARLPRTH